jgi:hypothetical protein
MARIRVSLRKIQRKHRLLFGFRRKVASQQMMILSAARLITRDVPSIYPSMVDQTNRQRQTNPHHSPWIESEYPGDRYNEKHRRLFVFRRKVASQQMMILSAARSITRDVPGIYPSMVDQTSRQTQTKPHHSPWLKSEYPGDRYNENTDGGLVSEEKLHHSR